MVSKIRSTSTGARPIDGSSSSSSRGSSHQRPAHRQHLLLAARHRSRLLGEALLQAREQVEDPVHVGGDLGLVVAQERAEVEVLGDGHAREDAPTLGLWAMPRCATSWPFRPEIRCPSK